MDKGKRASWARALFGSKEDEGTEVLEGAGRMPSVPSNSNAQAQQMTQRQSAAQEAKALDEQLPKDQAAAWGPITPSTKEGWDAVPLDITKDLEEVWGKPTPTATSQSSGQAPEAVAQPGDGWKGKQQTDAWVGGGGWSYARINTQDGEIIQATNPKSGKVVEVKPGMKNKDGMDLFTLIDTERQNQLTAGSTAPTDEMKRQASAEIASVTPSKGDMEKAMSMGGKAPAKAAKPKPVLGQEDMDYLFGSGASRPPALKRGEQALSEPDQLSSLAERGISKAMGGEAPVSQPVSIELNGKSYQVDQIGTMQESLNPFVKGITAVDPLTGSAITLQPGTPEFKQAVAALSNQTYSPPLPAGTAQAKPGATGNVFQVDGKSVIVVGGGTDPLNPGLKTPLMVIDQTSGQMVPQNSPAYAKAIQMAGVK